MDDDGGGGVGGGRRWRSGHRSRNEHGRDGEAGIGVGDGVIGSRMREHPHGDDESDEETLKAEESTTDHNTESSEDNSENPFDYQADCEDLFHEGDDDSNNTLSLAIK